MLRLTGPVNSLIFAQMTSDLFQPIVLHATWSAIGIIMLSVRPCVTLCICG